MKKFIFTLIVLIFSSAYSNVNSTINPKRSKEYNVLETHYKYMNKEAYIIIKKWTSERKLDIVLVCSLIDYESADHRKTKYNWEKMKKVRSHSGAIGIMQVMPVHSPKNPYKLEDPDFNINKGTWYLTLCIKKARKLGFKNIYTEGCRLYNSGTGGKRKKYRNWGYVRKIIKKYKVVKNSFKKQGVTI